METDFNELTGKTSQLYNSLFIEIHILFPNFDNSWRFDVFVNISAKVLFTTCIFANE